MSLKRYFLIGITLIILSTVNASAFTQKEYKRIYSSNYITNYLYGSVLHDENKHNLAVNTLRKNSKLKGQHSYYDIRYITSLAIDGKLDEAAQNVFALDNLYENVFVFNFIKSIFYLKNEEYEKASLQIKKLKSQDRLLIELKNVLLFWIEIETNKTPKEKLIKSFRSVHSPGITLINQFLASQYTGNIKLYNSYNSQILASDKFVRYKILSAWNESKIGQKERSLKILKKTLINNSENVLLKQSFKNFKTEDYRIVNFYNSKKINHNLSEIFYLFSALYQQRNDILFSDLLLSISLEFNKSFLSNNLLRFENKLINNPKYNFDYLFLNKLKNIGDEYTWHIDYNFARYAKEPQISSLKLLIKSEDIFIQKKYLDLANFYRTKKNYQSALAYYDKVEKANSDQDWSFYYYKGICYERLKKWKESEKNLQKSISLSPKKYTVINYLAYSWLERRENIDQATKMLEDAVKLSNWELGYIIDSLGWAYFLKKEYGKAEKILKIAYEKTPYESEVYDHYGDVLWKQKKYLQARYVWKNALNLENTPLDRKKRIQKKIINGLTFGEKN